MMHFRNAKDALMAIIYRVEDATLALGVAFHTKKTYV